MVVPTDRVSSQKTKKYMGNSQVINVSENYSTIKVIGNLCTLNVQRNDGRIKVIGDGCKVSVQTGRGTVNYLGNNGCVELGESFDGRNVEYIGNSGKLLKMVNGQLEEKTSSTKTAIPYKSGVNLNNRKSVHLGNCQTITIPYYEISISNLNTHKKR